jgi:hypothetical protein
MTRWELLEKQVLDQDRRIGLRVESALRALCPVSAPLADLLVVYDLRKMLEQELDALGHGHTQRP